MKYKIIIPKEEWISPMQKFKLKEEPKYISIVEKLKPLQEQWQKGMEASLNLKQETPEEVAENYANYNEQINKAIQEAVKFGAKWQQERSYSAEEVLNLLYMLWEANPRNIKEWFEQFKKK